MKHNISHNMTKKALGLGIAFSCVFLMACAPYQSHTAPYPQNTSPVNQSPIDPPFAPEKCLSVGGQLQCAFRDGLNSAFTGFPIEGLTAGLILGKFSGMRPSDFEGVQASQGVYYTQKGTLQFKFTAEYEHSAARSIQADGFILLRHNIENRLGVRANSPRQVRHILEDLRTK